MTVDHSGCYVWSVHAPSMLETFMQISKKSIVWVHGRRCEKIFILSLPNPSGTQKVDSPEVQFLNNVLTFLYIVELVLVLNMYELCDDWTLSKLQCINLNHFLNVFVDMMVKETLEQVFITY